MAITRLPDYPSVIGPLRVCVLDVDGPASYVTGGQPITAQACGMSWIEYAQGMYSSDKLNDVNPVAFRGAVKSINLLWLVNSTGAEVAALVNLSGKFVKILVIGR